MRFKIDLKIFLFVIIFYFTKQIHIYALIMLFAFIHELGHLMAGILCGMKPERLEIKPYGVSISFKIVPKDYNNKILNGNLLELKKIIVALAGPITNLVIILITLNLNNLNVFYGLQIVYSNLLLFIFNLLPIYPLDGGRILKGIIHIILGKRKSEIYTNYISFFLLIILTLISSILIFYIKNIAIFIAIIFLWVIYIIEDLKFRKRNKIYKLVEKTIEINAN